MKSFLEDTREGLLRAYELNKSVLEDNAELMGRLFALNKAARAAGFSSFLQIIFGNHHDYDICDFGAKFFMHASIAPGCFAEGGKALEMICRSYGFDWVPFPGGARLHVSGGGLGRCEVSADLHEHGVLGWRSAAAEAIAA